jgi:hypothetical protein
VIFEMLLHVFSAPDLTLRPPSIQGKREHAFPVIGKIAPLAVTGRGRGSGSEEKRRNASPKCIQVERKEKIQISKVFETLEIYNKF